MTHHVMDTQNMVALSGSKHKFTDSTLCNLTSPIYRTGNC